LAVHPEEEGLIARLAEILAKRVPTQADVVCPLTSAGMSTTDTPR
jgi:hypothetical protein